MTRVGVSKIAGPALVIAVITLTLGAGSARAVLSTSWCAPVGSQAPPCVASATLNGNPLLASDPNFSIQLVPFAAGGSDEFSMTVENGAGGADLGPSALSDTFSVVVNGGTLVPRVAFAQGSDVSFERNPEPGGTYRMTITANPVAITDNSECSYPGGGLPTCPYEATNEFAGYLSAQVSDYDGWPTPSQIDSFYGMDLSTNIAETGLPPQLVPDPATPGADEVVLDLANQHELPGGVTFYGFLHMSIPGSFLQTVYGIDDPSTVTDTGLAASVGAGGGTVAIQVAPGGGALLVDITGLTFSSRVLTIRRGVITPTRPLGLIARRTSAGRGQISFRAAKPRGSRITFYRASCATITGHSKVKAKSSRSPVKLSWLRVGHAYRCTVVAHARAGAGQVSSSVNLAS